MKEIDEIYHNLSPEELWALGKNTPKSELNWTKAEHREFEQLCILQDQTGLDFAILRLILNNPKEASISDVLIYCKALGIDPHVFLDTLLTKTTSLDIAVAA